MPTAICRLLALIPAFVPTPGESLPRWSPDGRWVAYTATSPAGLNLPQPGWIFDGRVRGPSPASTPAVARVGEAAREPALRRVIVASVKGDENWVLAESSRLAGGPEWSPDGRSLAYGRLGEPVRPGFDRFELVTQDGLGPGRVFFSREIPSPGVSPGLGPDPSRLTLAWSPDGRRLAVTVPDTPLKTVVLRADNGRVVRELGPSYWPAWSDDGERLVVVGGEGDQTLHLAEIGVGPPRRMAELGRLYQPPVWTRDANAVVCVAKRRQGLDPGGAATIDYCRVSVRTGEIEGALNLGLVVPGRHGSVRGVSFAVDKDASELFSSIDQEGQDSVVVWSFPRRSETLSRTHPLDFLVPVRGLSLSPSGKALAVRLGGPDSALGVWNPAKNQIVPIVPDDESRVAWLGLLVSTSRRLLGACLPPVAVAGRAVVRPTPLPVPGEVAPNHELISRLRRLAHVARPLCDRPRGSGQAPPGLEQFLTEARLFFDVLKEDSRSALASLDRLDAVTEEPDRRLALLSVRAQILLSAADWERAKEPIDYLCRLDQNVNQSFEVTPAGFALAPDPRPTAGWGRYLAQRAADLSRSRRGPARSPDPFPNGRNGALPFRQGGPRLPLDFIPPVDRADRP